MPAPEPARSPEPVPARMACAACGAWLPAAEPHPFRCPNADSGDDLDHTLQPQPAEPGALALWVVVRDPATLPPRARLLLVPTGIVLLVGIVQLVPLPAAPARVLTAPTAEARASLADVLPEMAAAPAPLITMRVEASSRPVRCNALISPAAAMIAVPC